MERAPVSPGEGSRSRSIPGHPEPGPHLLPTSIHTLQAQHPATPILRPRLNAFFEGRTATYIGAPAGFGKTTAALGWVTTLPQAHIVYVSSRQVLPGIATMSGDPELPEPLQTAISTAYGPQASSLLRNPQALSPAPSSATPTTVLVLDDLDRVPAQHRTSLLQLAIAWSRHHPHHHLIAIGRLVQDWATHMFDRYIGPDDLLFTPAEITTLTRTWVRNQSPHTSSQHVAAFSGGWPIALTLAENQVPAHPDTDDWHLLDAYLQTEVWSHLPSATLEQLGQCWPLDEITVELWTELMPTATSAEAFKEIQRVVPLSRHLVRSSHHPVFRLPEIVRQRLQSQFTSTFPNALGHRLITWWLDQNRLDQAMLIAQRLDCWSALLQELHTRCAPLALRDFHVEIIALLQPVPPSVLETNLDLLFWYALALLSETRYAEGEAYALRYNRVTANSHHALTSGRGLILNQLVAIFRGDAAAARANAAQALETLPNTAMHEQFRALATAEVLARHSGNEAESRETEARMVALRDELPADQRWWFTFVMPNRADWFMKTGRLTAAEQLLRHQLLASPSHSAGIIQVRLAIIALERGETDLAAHWLAHLSQEPHQSYWWLEAALTSVQIHRANCTISSAVDELYAIIADRNRHQSPVEIFRPQLLLAEIWIEQGQTELAASWLDLASRSLDAWPRSFGQPIPGLIRARLAMARHQWIEALQLLQGLEVAGLRRGHSGLLVQILAHLAFVQAHLQQLEVARATVKRAEAAADSGTYHRSFQIGTVDIRTFLDPTTTSPDHERPTSAQTATILSSRELEVLRLASLGLTNLAIAEQLFVSRYTVKNHLANVYLRLGARNRAEAANIAGRMGLLEDRPGTSNR